MSQTVTDAYLASQKAPSQTLEINQQYGNVRMVTPIGRFAYVTLTAPKGIAGSPSLKYSLTLLLNPESCGDIYKAICMVADKRWPFEDRPDPAANMQMKRYTGAELLMVHPDKGGLHYPLRRGDDTYMKDPAKYGAFRGLFSINASINDKNKNGQSNQPPCFDESGTVINPDRMYSGCYGRLQITVFAFPQPGQQIPNRGVGIMLNTVQFARHGEKLATFDAVKAGAAAFAAAGAIPVDPTAPSAPAGAYNPPPGFGPNAATPASIPPGFAAPTAPIAPQQTAQQPWQPPAA